MNELSTQLVFERNKYNDWVLANNQGSEVLTKVFGTDSIPLATHWLNQYIKSFPNADGDSAIVINPNIIIEYLKGINAGSCTEALLSLNMLMLQEQTFMMSRRLSDQKYMSGFTTFTNCISKLSSAFAKQADAIAKLRGKSGNTYLQQVNVNQGGQAVVNQGNEPRRN